MYIFTSKHGPYIKVGHYSKNNAWSRIAHRGFNSCICPTVIKGKVMVDDMQLLAWFPKLDKSYEKKVLAKFTKERVCGEWYVSSAAEQIKEFLATFDTDSADQCDRACAIATRRRL